LTLIAGFRAFGVPILIGDFLLTQRGQPSGLGKKLRLLRANCAVAWTGRQLAAEYVIRFLDEALAPGQTTRVELEDCLRRCKVAELGELSVRIVGWVVDEREHCFRWNSAYSHEVFYDEPIFDGSGDDAIKTMIERRFVNDPKEPTLVSVERAVDAALDIAANLISDETFGGANRSQGFGHAYEVLYLEDRAFHYVTDVLYVLLAFSASEHGKLANPTLCRPVYKYQALGELSVVDTLGDHNERLIQLITAVGDSRSKARARDYARQFEQTAKSERHFGFESSYYCIFVQVVSGPLVGHLLTTVQNKDWPPDQRFIKATRNEFTVQLPATTLDELYSTLRKYRSGPVG
jgi:hypothetical protein